MPALLLALIVAGGHLQELSPIFRAEAYVVVLNVSSFTRGFFGGAKPNLGLKIDEVTIVIEDKTYLPAKLEADEKRPGHYFLSFSPPEKLRDGKPRQVEVRFRKGAIKMMRAFPKPAPSS